MFYQARKYAAWEKRLILQNFRKRHDAARKKVLAPHVQSNYNSPTGGSESFGYKKKGGNRGSKNQTHVCPAGRVKLQQREQQKGNWVYIYPSLELLGNTDFLWCVYLWGNWGWKARFVFVETEKLISNNQSMMMMIIICFFNKNGLLWLLLIGCACCKNRGSNRIRTWIRVTCIFCKAVTMRSLYVYIGI